MLQFGVFPLTVQFSVFFWVDIWPRYQLLNYGQILTKENDFRCFTFIWELCIVCCYVKQYIKQSITESRERGQFESKYGVEEEIFEFQRILYKKN